jgi:hypothetical protein
MVAAHNQKPLSSCSKNINKKIAQKARRSCVRRKREIRNNHQSYPAEDISGFVVYLSCVLSYYVGQAPTVHRKAAAWIPLLAHCRVVWSN